MKVKVSTERGVADRTHWTIADASEIVIEQDNSTIHITPTGEGIVVRSEGRQGIMLTPFNDKTVEIVTF